MSTFKKITFGLLLLIMLLPGISFAQETIDLVPCATTRNTHECTFKDALKLINNVTLFILYYLAVPICALMFAYAGFTMVMSQSAEGKTKAKQIFSSAVFGLIIVAGAFLIVQTILAILGFDGSWLGFKS